MSSQSKTRLLDYLIQFNGESRIPPISQISKDLGISPSSVREQLEVARTLGFIEAKTKTGIRLTPYSLRPAILHSLNYGVRMDSQLFNEYSDLRKHLEIAYWDEAVSKLTVEDVKSLEECVALALKKLASNPVFVPHAEHKTLHLTIFKRLGNPVVLDLLESYWALYEFSGLNIFVDLAYLTRVWNYHNEIVAAIKDRQFDLGKELLRKHLELIYELQELDKRK